MAVTAEEIASVPLRQSRVVGPKKASDMASDRTLRLYVAGLLIKKKLDALTAEVNRIKRQVKAERAARIAAKIAAGSGAGAPSEQAIENEVKLLQLATKLFREEDFYIVFSRLLRHEVWCTHPNLLGRIFEVFADGSIGSPEDAVVDVANDEVFAVEPKESKAMPAKPTTRFGDILRGELLPEPA